MQSHDDVIRTAAQGIREMRVLLPEYGVGARTTARGRIVGAARKRRVKLLHQTMRSDVLAMLLPTRGFTALLLSRGIPARAEAVALRMAIFQVCRDADDLTVLLPATSPPNAATLAAFIDLIPRPHAQQATRSREYRESLIHEMNSYMFNERGVSPAQYASAIVTMRMECWLRYEVSTVRS